MSGASEQCSLSLCDSAQAPSSSSLPCQSGLITLPWLLHPRCVNVCLCHRHLLRCCHQALCRAFPELMLRSASPGPVGLPAVRQAIAPTQPPVCPALRAAQPSRSCSLTSLAHLQVSCRQPLLTAGQVSRPFLTEGSLPPSCRALPEHLPFGAVLGGRCSCGVAGHRAASPALSSGRSGWVCAVSSGCHPAPWVVPAPRRCLCLTGEGRSLSQKEEREQKDRQYL